MERKRRKKLLLIIVVLVLISIPLSASFIINRKRKAEKKPFAVAENSTGGVQELEENMDSGTESTTESLGTVKDSIANTAHYSGADDDSRSMEIEERELLPKDIRVSYVEDNRVDEYSFDLNEEEKTLYINTNAKSSIDTEEVFRAMGVRCVNSSETISLVFKDGFIMSGQHPLVRDGTISTIWMCSSSETIKYVIEEQSAEYVRIIEYYIDENLGEKGGIKNEYWFDKNGFFIKEVQADGLTEDYFEVDKQGHVISFVRELESDILGEIEHIIERGEDGTIERVKYPGATFDYDIENCETIFHYDENRQISRITDWWTSSHDLVCDISISYDEAGCPLSYVAKDFYYRDEYKIVDVSYGEDPWWENATER